jgi:serine/threonine protein kinase
MAASHSKAATAILAHQHGYSDALTRLQYDDLATTPSDACGMCRQNLVHERKHASVWDHYEIAREIGHGMTGKVYQVQHKLTKEKYALKCESMARSLSGWRVAYALTPKRRHGNAED